MVGKPDQQRAGGAQREAILKIAALAAAQNDVTNAAASLEKYMAQFPGSPGAELALLTLGELRLKDFMDTAAPNQLSAAQTDFDQFIGAFTNSPLTGKACLDRGWCNWKAGNYANSLVDFRAAAQRLPASADLAVAKFKTGDALFMLGDFAGARENYRRCWMILQPSRKWQNLWATARSTRFCGRT